MVLYMREDIREARKRIWQSVQFLPEMDADLKEAVYNIVVKAYLKGYYEAIQLAKDEIGQEFGVGGK